MKELLRFWKNKLQLNDWIIKIIDDCNVMDFKIPECCGETEWDTVNKCAVIRIISKKEYGNRVAPLVKEKVLIHEMLHIKFSLLWESNSDTQNLILHQIIEDLAKTLYNAKNNLTN